MKEREEGEEGEREGEREGEGRGEEMMLGRASHPEHWE